MSRPAAWPAIPAWAKVTLFGLLYFGGSEWGYAQRFSGVGSAFWPNCGLGVAALLLSERRLWPWLLAITFPACYASDLVFHGGFFFGSTVMAAGNALAAVVPAWLFTRVGAEAGDPSTARRSR